jgi:hypothetical protein
MKPYFSHDEGARNDPKLVQVMMELGHEGKSVYWDLVEMLYEQGGHLMLSQCKGYAFALRTNCDLILRLVNDFELFVTDGEKFWSETALRRLIQRNAKSEKAKESAAKRWGSSERNANALPTQSDRNAIKVKESKVKESKSNDLLPQPPAAELASPLKAEKADDPRGPGRAEVLADEAHVFTIAGFRDFVNTIGFGKIDVGFYLPQIQYEAAKQPARPNDGPGKTWEAFVKFYLNNERKYDRVTYPAAPTAGNYAGPNPALQLTTTASNYSLAALAARNTTKY